MPEFKEGDRVTTIEYLSEGLYGTVTGLSKAFPGLVHVAWDRAMPDFNCGSDYHIPDDVGDYKSERLLHLDKLFSVNSKGIATLTEPVATKPVIKAVVTPQTSQAQSVRRTTPPKILQSTPVKEPEPPLMRLQIKRNAR